MEVGLSEPDTQDAQRGRLFHKYFTNPNYDRSLLTPDERELLATSDRLRNDLLDILRFNGTQELCVEQTMTGLDGRLTGTPDEVRIWPDDDASLVLDLKSGFKIVERAELNLQLRGYAVLVHEHFLEAQRVFVAILQPRIWLPSERVTVAQYDEKEIVKSRDQINQIIDRTEDKKAPLVAGEDQCRFCRAKLICPAFRAALRRPLRKFKTEEQLSKLKRDAEIKKRVKGCNDQQLEQLLEAVKIAHVVDEAVRSECRERIRDGRFTNYVLGKESEVRNVTNVHRAVALLALSGVATREEIINLCNMPLHSLEERYRAQKGGTWRDARDKIDKVLSSVLQREPREPKILPRELRKK